MKPTDRLKTIEPARYEALAEYLKTNNHFLITGHIRADGDAIAATCFLQQILSRMGKTSFAFVSDPEPDPKYQFLAGFQQLHSIQNSQPDFSPQTALVLDSPTLDRIGDGINIVAQCQTQICIDHHLGNEILSSLDINDTSASSTCEILARLIPHLDIDITPDIAEILYTGIMFDTGNFRFSNTTASALATASVLVELGANPEKLNDQIFFGWSLQRVKAMAMVMESLKLYRGHRIAITYLPAAFYSSHPDIDRDMEGFSDIGISIQGVRIAAFMKEKSPEEFKISLRAIEDYDVASVAAEFGGGGHKKASGCHINGEFNTVLEKVLDTIQRCNPRLNRAGR